MEEESAKFGSSPHASLATLLSSPNWKERLRALSDLAASLSLQNHLNLLFMIREHTKQFTEPNLKIQNLLY